MSETVMQAVEGRWIRFVPALIQNPKTQVWWVLAKQGGGVLGEVRWFAPWRRYAFYPADGSLYEQDCLRAIAGFVETLTKEHRREP